ncbi:hypothetical protein BCR42DRAFT_82073 [Absidia repens]|uniref:Chromatin target of PRMT1 protein C-terminal domain-containing protein n=1 Tax=Absidia repens TaxID=90262 RepID=A0A1X2I9X2_9FUNG|nr:hypothetical protein BCR42DRAFT_82073 [Absidia repens]
MSPFHHRAPQDRRVTTVGGGLNERFGRLEKPAPTPRAVVTTVEAQRSTSVFSRIKGANGTSSSVKKRGNASDIQSRIGRVSAGSIQKRVGKNQTTTSRKLKSMAGVGSNRGKQTTKLKADAKQGSKGNRKTDLKNKQNKTKTLTGDDKRKKKALSADDLDKALDTYMMKDPKTAQARLNDELDSYMDEAGDVLMDL